MSFISRIGSHALSVFMVVVSTLYYMPQANAQASAQSPTPSSEIFKDTLDYIGLSIGRYDILDDHEAYEFRLEYASGKAILGPLKPLITAELTEKESLYIATGFLLDIMPIQSIYIKPSWTIGVYEEGDGKDLGDGAIMRSQLEIGYQFENKLRFGLAFSHLSNGWQDKDNDGTEVLSTYMHIPTESLFSDQNGLTQIPYK